MELVKIFGDTVWSVRYEGDNKDIFSQRMEEWMDMEFLDNFFNENKIYIEQNNHFKGHTFKEILVSAKLEANRFLKDFTYFYKNGCKGRHPNFEDKFVSYDKFPFDIESQRKKKMFGAGSYEINSMFRLYAIRIDSEEPEKPPCYIIIGGGIKIKRSVQQDRLLMQEVNRFHLVENWLKKNKIQSKGQLILQSDGKI